MINKNYNGSNRPSILVNYYKNPDYINIKSAYVGNKAGTKYDVVDFFDIDTASLRGVSKENLDFIKIFNNGINNTGNSIDFKYWSGLIFIDIDSKKCWENRCIDDEGNKYSIDDVEDSLNEHLINNYDDNYIGLQRSASGKSWHLFFYFDIDNIGLDKSRTTFNVISSVIFNSLKNLFSQIKTFDNRLSFDCFLKDGVMDDCSKVANQPLYISGYDFKYNYLNPTGTCQNEQLRKRIINVRKCYEDDEILKTEFTVIKSNIKLNKNVDVDSVSWEHSNRVKLLIVLGEIFKGNKEQAYDVYKNIIPLIVGKGNDHTQDELKDLFNKQFDNIYKGKYNVSKKMLNWLEDNSTFKYQDKTTFKHKRIDDFKYDKIFDLNENEYLSNVFDKIININNNCIHVEAGCGLGKTHSAIDYTNTDNLETFDFLFNNYNKMFRRICFITPMTSINRGNFTDLDNWVIVDSEHKGNYSNISNSKSVCTTWDSFVNYKFDEQDFDIFIFDEVHSLYLYDYRLQQIHDIKTKIKELSKHKKVILFTGTPSYERIEFNTYNVKVNKNVHHVKCNIVFYNNEKNGWLFNNVKEWIEQDKNNIVMIFDDRTNMSKYEWWDNRGIKVDNIYCKSNKETVDAINTNKSVCGQVNLFSVYGQAGINIYAKPEQKVRIYIMNNNAMSIIQYINRLRNKEHIDCIYIPFKRKDIKNDYYTFDIIKDKIYEENKFKVESNINTFNLSRYDFEIENINEKFDFDNPDKQSNRLYNSIKRKHHFDINYCTYNKQDGFIFNNSLYKVYGLIEVSNEYESQIQIIYNRLIDSQINVDYIYLESDEKDVVSSKKCGSNFFGAMNKFNVEKDIHITKSGTAFLKDESNIYKFASGETVDNINYILDYLYTNKIDIQDTFDIINKKLINKYNTITQKNIKDVATLFELESKLPLIKNGRYLHLLKDESYDIKNIVAEYVCISYKEIKEDKTNKIAASNINEYIIDTYSTMKELRKILNDYPELIDISNVEQDIQYNGEYNKNKAIEIYKKCLTILKDNRGGSNQKQIKVTFDDGRTKTYNSQDECSKDLGISRVSINQILKSETKYSKKLRCKINNL